MNKLHQALALFLKNKADDAAVIKMHNAYAPTDDFIYNSIEDIADVFGNDDPTNTAIARMVFFGDVRSWHDHFFYLDGCGNINSFNNVTDRRCPIDLGLLAVYIIENGQYANVGFNAGPYLSDDE